MIICIGEGFWGKGKGERQAFDAAKKHAPHNSRPRVNKCDFYFIANEEAEGAHVDEVGNLVHKAGVKPMKLVVESLPHD